MTLAILLHFLCTQHVSDINIFTIRSLRLCCWITTSVVLFSVRRGFSLQHGHYSNPAAPNLQHTTNREQNDRCGNSTAQSQAPDGGYINVRNMLSTKWKKIASDIKLVFYSSTITMMHYPINICNTHSDQLKVTKLYTAVSLLLDSCIIPSHCSGYTSAHWGKKLWKTPHIVH